jgi:hypothetical protein
LTLNLHQRNHEEQCLGLYCHGWRMQHLSASAPPRIGLPTI